MHMHLIRFFPIIAGSALMAGCGNTLYNNAQGLTAALQAVEDKEQAQVIVTNSIISVSCSGQSIVKSGDQLQDRLERTISCRDRAITKINGNKDNEYNNSSLDQAFSAFYSVYSLEASEGIVARNRVQDTIRRAADNQCGKFKVVLARARSSVDFYTGLTGVISGTLGTLFTSRDVSRGLSAVSGVAAGGGATFNEAFFQGEGMKIIYAGIDLKREELGGALDSRRQDNLKTYSLEHAVGDAIRYADACNVIEGLSKVADRLAAGQGEKLGEALGARIGKKIDALSLPQLQSFAKSDAENIRPKLDGKVPLLPGPDATEADKAKMIEEFRAFYRKLGINANGARQAQILMLLDEAAKLK